MCEPEILRVTVKRIEVFSLFMLISDDFQLKVPKIAKKGTYRAQDMQRNNGDIII